LDKLVQEFTTYYYYTILRVNAIGLEGEGLKEIIEGLEDRNHFEALILASTSWVARSRETFATLPIWCLS